MKIISTSSKSNRALQRIRGFSLLEMMIVLAAISSVAAMGVVHLSNTTEAVKAAKLRQDVAALNSAVRTYVMSGGDLSSVSSGASVIAKLKTIATTIQRASIAGLRNSMVDLRLRGVDSSEDGALRAVWNEDDRSFAIQDSGDGFREFLLDGAVPANPTEESRSVVMAMNSADKWIWSFEDRTLGTRGPRARPAVEESPVVEAGAAGSIPVLQAPEFSIPGALYGFDDFNPDMKVSLVDPNTANTSRIFYSISNGPWQQWMGLPLSIPRALTTELRAYSTPLDADRFEESAVASAAYETIYFDGTSAGAFSGPLGDSGLVSNLAAGGTNPFFTWGSPAVAQGFPNPNSLKFAGKDLGTIAPDQLFELGTLTYYNGSTYAGTNASSVQLNISLNLTTPGVVETLPFTFKLLSTSNKGVDPDADADFVYIPNVSTQFNTIIKGQTFYLVLSFGSNSANGFTTIDEFHTHENKTMTGSIYGRFTTTPPLP